LDETEDQLMLVSSACVPDSAILESSVSRVHYVNIQSAIQK